MQRLRVRLDLSRGEWSNTEQRAPFDYEGEMSFIS
jgi:hypothetical protein